MSSKLLRSQLLTTATMMSQICEELSTRFVPSGGLAIGLLALKASFARLSNTLIDEVSRLDFLALSNYYEALSMLARNVPDLEAALTFRKVCRTGPYT